MEGKEKSLTSMTHTQLRFCSHRDTFPVIEMHVGETVDHLKKDQNLATCDDSQEVKGEVGEMSHG